MGGRGGGFQATQSRKSEQTEYRLLEEVVRCAVSLAWMEEGYSDTFYIKMPSFYIQPLSQVCLTHCTIVSQ